MADKPRHWEDEPSVEGLGFLQDIRGVPYSFFQNKGEYLLSTLNDIRQRLPERDGSSLEYPSNMVEVLPPQVHVDVGTLASELSPHFGALIDAQRELQDTVRDMGWQGQRLLESTEVTNEHLSVLGEQGGRALRQRNSIIQEIVESNRTLFSMDKGISRLSTDVHNVGYAIDRSNQRLASIDNQLPSIRAGIDNVSHVIGLSNQSLASIEGQLPGIEAGIDSVNTSVRTGHIALANLLQEIGADIVSLTEEQIAARMEIVDTLRGFQSMYFWTHRETIDQLRNMAEIQNKIAYALYNRREVEALETWHIAEKCRAAGDFENTQRMLDEGLRLNPAEPRLYASYGAYHTEQGRAREAISHLDKAADFAQTQQNPRYAAYCLMKSVKLSLFEQDFRTGRDNAERAVVLDPDNLECWFDSARCLCLLEEYVLAKRILLMLMRRSARYRLRISAEPLFWKIQ